MSTRFLSTLCRVWTLAVREGVSMVGWKTCLTWDQTHSQGTLISRISSPVCPNSLATTRACRGLTPTCKCATVCRSHDWGPSMWSIQRQNYCVEQSSQLCFLYIGYYHMDRSIQSSKKTGIISMKWNISSCSDEFLMTPWYICIWNLFIKKRNYSILRQFRRRHAYDFRFL